MTDTYDAFYVGANVLVVREGKLLMGKRKNIAGDGTWALPGGHLEHGESIAAAAARELEEETGLVARNLTFVGLVNNPKDKGKHYIQLGFRADGVTGEPELREPDRCSEWRWFPLDDLPEITFGGHDRLIKLMKEDAYFSDSK